jgi:hypothetical protein
MAKLFGLESFKKIISNESKSCQNKREISKIV